MGRSEYDSYQDFDVCDLLGCLSEMFECRPESRGKVVDFLLEAAFRLESVGFKNSEEWRSSIIRLLDSKIEEFSESMDDLYPHLN